MSGIAQSRSVEARSWLLLEPFLQQVSEGRYVLTNKGRLSKSLQGTVGDLLFNDRDGRLWGVELKAEEEYRGNLFLETWSNRNLNDPQSHADRGSNPGWLMKTRADLLFYHFLDADALFIMNMFMLKRWAFQVVSKNRSEFASRIRSEPLTGRIYDFPEREQKKYSQLNDTWGRCVPISVLADELPVPPHRHSVEQLRLEMDGSLV